PPCSPFLFCCLSPFYFTAPATPEILTLSLHDALPISTSEILGIQVLLHHETGGEHRGQRQRRDVVLVPRRLVGTPLHSRAVQVVPHQPRQGPPHQHGEHESRKIHCARPDPEQEVPFGGTRL